MPQKRVAFRQLDLQEGDKVYSFIQFEGDKYASFDIYKNGELILVQGKFDPAGQVNPGEMWGTPRPGRGLAHDQFREDCESAMRLLNDWGGPEKFNKLSYDRET